MLQTRDLGCGLCSSPFQVGTLHPSDSLNVQEGIPGTITILCTYYSITITTLESVKQRD